MQVNLARQIDGAHRSNRELVEYVFAKIPGSLDPSPLPNGTQGRGKGDQLRSLSGAIGKFLLLVDDCVTGLNVVPAKGCPISGKALRARRDEIKTLGEAAWVRLGRVFEGDEESPDEQIREEGRKRWYIHSNAPLSRGEETMDDPGQWISYSDLARLNRPIIPLLETGPACSVCSATEGKLKRCAGCFVAKYCSRECQVQHWKRGGHKEECKSLQESIR